MAAPLPGDASRPRAELVNKHMVNRPFLYIVMHMPTGAVVHVAKVTEPEFLGKALYGLTVCCV